MNFSGDSITGKVKDTSVSPKLPSPNRFCHLPHEDKIYSYTLVHKTINGKEL